MANMPSQFRLFVAVELSEEVKAALAAAQERLRRDRPPVKWVAPEAMHLTLQFLGATDGRLLPRIGEALRVAAGDRLRFDLQLAGQGAFPNTRRPSVLWVGVAGAAGALEGLQAAIGAALDPLGFPPETRPFHPHLTLGRVRREASPLELRHLAAALQAQPSIPPVSWRIDRVVLFESELRREGPRYTERDAVELRGEP